MRRIGSRCIIIPMKKGSLRSTSVSTSLIMKTTLPTMWPQNIVSASSLVVTITTVLLVNLYAGMGKIFMVSLPQVETMRLPMNSSGNHNRTLKFKFTCCNRLMVIQMMRLLILRHSRNIGKVEVNIMKVIMLMVMLTILMVRTFMMRRRLT